MNYFTTWSDARLQRELAYKRNSQGEDTTYSACDCQCGRYTAGGGPCLMCCEAEVERRKEMRND